MEKKSIYKKLQDLRVEVLDSKITKSGKNNYAGFSYFEISDFIALSNRLMLKHGLTPVFNLTEQKASLVLYDHDSDEKIAFYTPVDTAMQGKVAPIQDIGARHTYAKRYLYLNVLELEENDPVNATIGKDKVQQDKSKVLNTGKATLGQKADIQRLYKDDQETLKQSLAKAKVSKIEDLPMDLAQKMIEFKS